MKSGRDGNKNDPEVIAALIVEDFIRDLSCRTGLSDAWDGISGETCLHIADQWQAVAKKHVEAAVLATREACAQMAEGVLAGDTPSERARYIAANLRRGRLPEAP